MSESRSGDRRESSNATAAYERTRWYALYTRARHEKKVNLRLRERRFEVCLPLVPRLRQWHDRKKVVEWPLFPGYVFARFGAAAAAQVLGTPGVATVVRRNGAPAPIPDEEIENVRRLAAVVAETGAIPEPTPLVERGQHVRITCGPLEGVEGVVVERRGGSRILIQVGVEAIGQGVKVEVEASRVRLLDGSGRLEWTTPRLVSGFRSSH